MAEVKLENVTKIYDGGVPSVQDMTLTVHDKEFVVLVGPSGCGKSTALRMIAGLEEITSGTIRINNEIVNDVPPKDRDIAMVFQNYALYPHMTVYENLAFGLKMRKHTRSDVDSQVHRAAKILELEELLTRKPKALSGGQRQRVALGRAIVRSPKVFLFDEPLSNLDANLRVQMRTEISKLHQRLEATMIYVTHDQIEAMSMGDRIVILNNGIVQQVDAPLNIYKNPANKFVAGFIGSPTMNFFDGRISNETGIVFQQNQGTFRLKIPQEKIDQLKGHIGREITMGIRPEHITERATAPTSQPVEVHVEVTEPVGNEIFVYFSIKPKPEQYVTRLPSDVRPRSAASLQVFFDPTKAHFFDRMSGSAL